jgi:hypothetical protein
LLVGCDREPDASKDPAPQPAAQTKDAKEVMDECPGHKAESGSCEHEEPAKADANHFGTAFTLDKSEPLSTVAERLKNEKKTVQVSGKVESVCQTKGCWMVLEDGKVRARVFTKGHGFFLPKDIAGRNAVVEGELEQKTISEKFAKHLEEDKKGGDPSKVSGDQSELVMNATAVALR